MMPKNIGLGSGDHGVGGNLSRRTNSAIGAKDYPKEWCRAKDTETAKGEFAGTYMDFKKSSGHKWHAMGLKRKLDGLESDIVGIVG